MSSAIFAPDGFFVRANGENAEIRILKVIAELFFANSQGVSDGLPLVASLCRER
jgi:hypothetical protein